MSVIKPEQRYTKKEIERRAADLLSQMQAKPNYAGNGRRIDASRVADFLDIGVVWESLPSDDQGQIAAMILPLQREIVINKNIPKLREGYGQSTIAHEIGHWLLHINQDEVEKIVDRMEHDIEVTLPPFLCRSASDQLYQSIANTQIDWREWQAQYLASCLLMPVHILEQAQKPRDLTKWSHLYAMADELGVTISNLRNRLRGLDWIRIAENSKQIYLGDAAPSKKTGAF
ncbi:ImmA/IrrE family metallo-endopeptidase [Nostoc sp. B(2019)]|nr:ImmA/IrrE family metallo-endopeptidase [Nostoc sp. B(2019)]